MDVTTEKLEGLSLNEVADSSDSSDLDYDDVEASDAMLGTLERGLDTISSHAREYMSTCTTDENRKDMQGRLETSMLSLLRSEQVVKELPTLVTDVVDHFVTEMDDENEEKSENENTEGEQPLHFPSLFKPMHKMNEGIMGQMSQKLFQLFQEKVDDFEHSLTEEKLKKLPRFEELTQQVALSFDDMETKAKEQAIVGGGDANFSQDGVDDMVKFHDVDDLSDDESILPSIDPFTKKPMVHPVRNKYCNHIFEEQSVLKFMMTNQNPRCPLEYCRNERPFEKDHFVKIPKLTEQIRRRNMKEKK